MLARLQKVLFFLFNSSLYGMMVGNPAQPILMSKGIFIKNAPVSFRVGYFDDWVYKQRFQEGFLSPEKTRTKNKLSTLGGIATLNILNKFDLYTLLGSSIYQVDDQIFSKRSFAWCVGCKFVLLKHKNFFLGFDAKYFQTDQNPQFFVIEGMPYNVMNQYISQFKYTSKYYDAQASLGLAYKISLFVPYVNATYIYSKIIPKPPVVLVRFPDEYEMTNIQLPSLISRKVWGLALGFSFVDISKATLAFEWRLFNQNAINVNGEIRF